MKAHRAKKRSAPRAGASLQTRLRHAQRRLHEVEARYEIAMGAINEGVYDWDIARDRIFYSESVQRALGLPPALLRTREDWWKRIHPDDRPRYQAAFVAHFKGETQRFECDYRYRALDGSWRWARQHGVAVRDARGRAVRMVGANGDITELKRVEDSLRKSEERHALATSAALEGIYEWDLESGLLYLTERAKEFFSFPDEQLTPAEWNRRVHGEDFAAYRAAIVDHFKGLTPHLEHEYRIADAPGGYKWVLDRGIAVRDAAGRVVKVVGAVSDITARKLAEIELRRARDEATDALDQQKALAEVLGMISGSIADTKPVFEKILDSCQRLFEGHLVGLTLAGDDGMVHLGAYQGDNKEEMERIYPMPLSRESGSGCAILERKVMHFTDVGAPGSDAPPQVVKGAQTAGFKSIIFAPLIAEGRGIGALWVGRRGPGPFSDKQTALLQSFADQAVIAIENVRLLNETKEALEQQTASGEVLQAISGSIAETGPVFDKILESCQRLFAGRIVGINIVGADGEVRIGAYQGPHRDEFEHGFTRVLSRDSGTGRSILEQRVLHYPDIEGDEGAPPGARRGCGAIGIKSVIFAPMLWEGRGLGAIFVGRDHVSSFSDKEIALLKTFADQAAIAIENARLFREIQEKSQQLEIASRHKSDFLANMSHELRTPLNAIIGFTRIVMRSSKEQLAPKQYENLEKILSSGQSLLALINSILDLSKVEAGRVEVLPAEVPLAPVLEQCLRTVEPLVKAEAVVLVKEFDGTLPHMYVDEEKLRQIVINLLSNAAKFTGRGSIRVRARVANGSVGIAVTDTGIGIPADKLGLIFEEFEQADASSTRIYGGTGLGLTIARRLARLMGGDIRAESTPGSGSTFTLTLPVRYQG